MDAWLCYVLWATTSLLLPWIMFSRLSHWTWSHVSYPLLQHVHTCLCLLQYVLTYISEHVIKSLYIVGFIHDGLLHGRELPMWNNCMFYVIYTPIGFTWDIVKSQAIGIKLFMYIDILNDSTIFLIAYHKISETSIKSTGVATQAKQTVLAPSD